LHHRAKLEYDDLNRKKKIIESDRAKIQSFIVELEEKKKEAVQLTWEKVNKDFGSIFSSLLPGWSCQLVPPEGQSVMDGLEVRFARDGVWKDSLSELSGGQRYVSALPDETNKLARLLASAYLLTKCWGCSMWRIDRCWHCR